MMPTNAELINMSEESIHKIYRLLYDLRKFVESYQPLLAKEICPDHRRDFYTKIVDSKKELLFRLYCGLDADNKEKLFNIFLRYNSSYTRTEIEIAMNMLRWLVFYTAVHDYHTMIGMTKNLEKEVIYENELQMLDENQKKKVYYKWLLYKCPDDKDNIEEVVLEDNYDSDYEDPFDLRRRYYTDDSDDDDDEDDDEDEFDDLGF